MVNIEWIDTKIVYEPDRQLALAYNRAMESTSAEWVLFLDQDLFICNPHWYEMCLYAIKELKDKQPGWITAKCNRVVNRSQLHCTEYTDSNNVIDHINVARNLYDRSGNNISEGKGKFSGFFILTNKTAWKHVGGFEDVGRGLSGVDNNYSEKLKNNGFGLYVMEGLYFYHLWKELKRTSLWQW
jgi:GT2 family glycosyltransferase